MTRKILFPLLIGGLLLAGFSGCSPHEFPESETGDYAIRLVFDEELPLLTTVRPGTKAGSDAAETRYTVQLFPYRGELVFAMDPAYTFTFTRDELDDLETSFTLPVTGSRYKVAVWTDWRDKSGGESYDPTNFEHISMSGTYLTGDRQRDAFFGSADIELSHEGLTAPVTILMHRPVAQIRFILPEAMTFLTGRGIDATSLRATLRYTAPIADRFNLLLGQSSGARDGVSFTAIPWIDPSSGALVFCSDFVLTNDVQEQVVVDFSLADASGTVLFTYQGEVPVLRAHRTDVSWGYEPGDIDKPGGVGIDPSFDTETEIYI